MVSGPGTSRPGQAQTSGEWRVGGGQCLQHGMEIEDASEGRGGLLADLPAPFSLSMERSHGPGPGRRLLLFAAVTVLLFGWGWSAAAELRAVFLRQAFAFPFCAYNWGPRL